jgi:ParB family transcriptional regulator, chromosome partitioning protein
MGTRDSRAVHGAAAKKDLLLFDDDAVTLVTDEKHPLYDERVGFEPTESMILNVMVNGVIEPIIVWKDTESGKTFVVDGRQRVKSCREANKRIRKAGGDPHRIPAIVKRMDPGTSVGVMITLNEQRTADTPLNLARKADRMIELGKTEEEVAIAIGKSTATVKNLLRLLDAPAAVRNAVDSGKIAASDAYKLAKLEPGEAREKVAKLIEHAPRTPGKKRQGGAAARKAREIVDGPKRGKSNGGILNYEGMRQVHVVENVRRELEEKDVNGSGSSALTRGAVVALQWVLGDDAALKALGL